MTKKKVKFSDWGLLDYQKAWDNQEEIFNAIMEAKKVKRSGGEATIDHHVIFVEHPHVYTLGKSGSQSNLLINAIQLQAKHATFVNTNRGGDITYHGPGQIVGYPILDLEDLDIGLKQYIHLLEESIILSLESYGLKGERLEGATGVWLETNTGKARKICAIGVKSSRFVTMHGFAFNVNTELEYFNYINPCGFIDKGVTSLEKELGTRVNIEEVKSVVKKNMEKVFSLKFTNHM